MQPRLRRRAPDAKASRGFRYELFRGGKRERFDISPRQRFASPTVAERVSVPPSATQPNGHRQSLQFSILALASDMTMARVEAARKR